MNCNSTSIYTMDHPDLTISNDMEKSIGLKRVEVNMNHNLRA